MSRLVGGFSTDGLIHSFIYSFIHSFKKHLYLYTRHGWGEEGSNHVATTLFTYEFARSHVCPFIYYTLLS